MIVFKTLDHILISIPSGSKVQAKTFYSEVLELKEIMGNHQRGAL
jgi:hypothetical protein